MRILVPLKQIQDPAGLMVNRKAGKVFVNNESFIMNPASKRALEAALRFKDAGEAEVIALAFDSPGADSANGLRDARALGATRALLVKAPAPDPAVVVTLVKAVIAWLGEVDMVLFGDRTLDTGESSGARLAEALDWPFLAEAVDVSPAGNAVRIVRAGQAFEADLPAVVTVTRDGPAPRFAGGGNIIAMYRDPNAVETIAIADLGLSETDLTAATAERGLSFPPEREFGRQATVEEAAALIRQSRRTRISE